MSLATQQVAAVYGHSSIEQSGVGYVSIHVPMHGWSWVGYGLL